MAKFFLVHGAFGNPGENWFPWLKKELEALNHEVIVPKFPTPENQSLKNWSKVFEKYKGQVDENTVFVGHSMAPAFLLSVLEQIDVSIKGSFFVAGFLRFLDNDEFDSINETFIDREFDWKRIRQNCKQFFIYHSDNDPYVPLACAHELASKLCVKPKVIKNAGHFNKKSGYTAFEELLNDIKLVV